MIAMKKTTTATRMSGGVGGSNLTVTGLPEDVIFLILSYLDLASLGAICQTCSLLRTLASAECVWLPHSRRHALIKDSLTSQRYAYSLKEKCRVSHNWAQAHFRELKILRNSERLLPWLQYADSELWVSTKNCIKHYQVKKNGQLRKSSPRCLHGPREDVCRFVVKNNLSVCGCRDGSIYGWETPSGCLLFQYNLHASDTQCVDIIDDCVISGSRDATVKVSSMQPNSDGNRLRKTFDIGARIWSLSASPDNSVFASGSSGCNGANPLTIWDLASGVTLARLGGDHKRGAGVLDMKFESPYTLLTGGYDTNLRLWDLRVNTCVLTWEEPFDSAVYCLATDNNNTMITGTARYGMTRWWDKRSPVHNQVFFSGVITSPVYSLAFDWRRMYVALDLSTTMIDFTVAGSSQNLR